MERPYLAIAGIGLPLLIYALQELQLIKEPWVLWVVAVIGACLFVYGVWPYIKSVPKNIQHARWRSPVQWPVTFTDRSSLLREASTSLTNEQERFIQDLLSLWENQKTNPQQYFKVGIITIDCSPIDSATPHVTIWFRVSNYHLAKLKVTGIDGSVGMADNQNLPRLALSRQYSIDRCGETGFSEDLELHGTQIPVLIKAAAQAGREITWEFRGFWKGKIYGQVATIHDQTLDWKGIPNVPLPSFRIGSRTGIG